MPRHGTPDSGIDPDIDTGKAFSIDQTMDLAGIIDTP
jgi:hypothetical protein